MVVGVVVGMVIAVGQPVASLIVHLTSLRQKMCLHHLLEYNTVHTNIRNSGLQIIKSAIFVHFCSSLKSLDQDPYSKYLQI